MAQFLPGDVALSASNHTPLGWGIRVFTTSRYNHARLVIASDGTAIEAQARGALPCVVEPGDVVVRPPLTTAERRAIPGVAWDFIGTPYAYLDVLALGLAHVGLRTEAVRRRIDRPDRLFCSQLVDLAWERVGFHAFTDGRMHQNVAPGDIADLAFRNGWTVVQSGLVIP